MINPKPDEDGFIRLPFRGLKYWLEDDFQEFHARVSFPEKEHEEKMNNEDLQLTVELMAEEIRRLRASAKILDGNFQLRFNENNELRNIIAGGKAENSKLAAERNELAADLQAAKIKTIQLENRIENLTAIADNLRDQLAAKSKKPRKAK